MVVKELAKEIHENAVNKGFWEENPNIGEKLALIHSEISEALEADRKGKRCAFDAQKVEKMLPFLPHFKLHVKDTFEDELADVVIRVLDLAAHFEIDIETHIKMKMRYNETREYKHGKKY